MAARLPLLKVTVRKESSGVIYQGVTYGPNQVLLESSEAGVLLAAMAGRPSLHLMTDAGEEYPTTKVDLCLATTQQEIADAKAKADAKKKHMILQAEKDAAEELAAKVREAKERDEQEEALKIAVAKEAAAEKAREAAAEKAREAAAEKAVTEKAVTEEVQEAETTPVEAKGQVLLEDDELPSRQAGSAKLTEWAAKYGIKFDDLGDSYSTRYTALVALFE